METNNFYFNIENYKGISIKSNVLDGKPCITDTRIPVGLVLNYLADEDDPIRDLSISKEDVRNCLSFAAEICNIIRFGKYES